MLLSMMSDSNEMKYRVDDIALKIVKDTHSFNILVILFYA